MASLCNINVPCGTKPVFILGPTGSGKSAVAVELAEILGNSEIISADAYQVYKGMPIITAAPSSEELSRIKHHLVGFMEPTENNDAAEHDDWTRKQSCGTGDRPRKSPYVP